MDDQKPIIFEALPSSKKVEMFLETQGETILRVPRIILADFVFSEPEQIPNIKQITSPLTVTMGEILMELALREFGPEENIEEIVNESIAKLSDDFKGEEKFRRPKYDRACSLLRTAIELAEETGLVYSIMAEAALGLVLFDKTYRKKLEDEKKRELLVKRYLCVQERKIKEKTRI